MSKQRLHKIERKLQKRDSFSEYPLFVFTEEGGYIIADYILSRMGVNPNSYQQSKTEEASRVIYLESGIVYLSGEYLLFKNHSRGVIVL
jgi:hypothetical protein